MQVLIESTIKKHLENASNFATRGTIKLRCLFDIADQMGVSRETIYETKDCIRIDPSVSAALESVWNGSSLVEDQSSSLHAPEESSEDIAMLERFFAKDFVKPVEILKMTGALQKRFSASQDLIFRNLWCLFSVDGLSTPGDRLDRYFENLSLPLALGERYDSEIDEEPWTATHARAVRTVYRDVRYATPDRLGNMLRRVLQLNRSDTRCRGDGSSDPSSESSNGGDNDEEEEEDVAYDNHIADMYKKLVGKKLCVIALRIRERRTTTEKRESTEKLTKSKKIKSAPKKVKEVVSPTTINKSDL